MSDYLLTCRSLTYAQRARKVLERYGQRAVIMKTPQEISSRGCGYGLRLIRGNPRSAVNALRRAGVGPERVFLLTDDGGVKEAVF